MKDSTTDVHSSGSGLKEIFRKFSGTASTVVGSAWAFMGALLIIIVWAISGPMFDYSDTWQLVINTGTTIITFIMVFLIQNTQNRDAKVIHLKLDELLRAVHSARTNFAELERLSDDELARYEQEFLDICAKERHKRDHLAHATHAKVVETSESARMR